MSEELLGRLLRSSLVEDEGDPDVEEAVMQALATPRLPVLRQLAEPVDLEEDIFSALQLLKSSAGIQEGLVEEVDLEGDIFAALDSPSPGVVLRAALTAPVEVEAEVLSALAASSLEAPFAAILREGLATEVDLEAGVMGALEADLRGLLGSNLASEVDLEAGVMGALDGDLRGLLQKNLASEVDLEAGVMGALWSTEPASAQPAKELRPQPKIRSSAAPQEITRPVAAVAPRRRPWMAAVVSLTAAAAVAFLVVRGLAPATPEAAFVLSDRNVAEVEDLSASATASVQVMQFEENGPTFILVDEGAASDKAVPL